MNLQNQLSNRWYGIVGFAGTAVETAPGIMDCPIIEKDYYGNVMTDRTTYIDSNVINDNIRVNHKISIVGDKHAFDHCYDFRYITFSGYKWNISSVEMQYPRIILTLGNLYNE